MTRNKAGLKRRQSKRRAKCQERANSMPRFSESSKEHPNGRFQTPYRALLAEFVRGKQLQRLHVPDLNRVPKQADVAQLPHVLLLVVPIQVLRGPKTTPRQAKHSGKGASHLAAELGADMCELLIHPLLLLLLAGA